MGKIAEFFGTVCFLAFVAIGIIVVIGCVCDVSGRTMIHFVTDNMYFASKYVAR